VKSPKREIAQNDTGDEPTKQDRGHGLC